MQCSPKCCPDVTCMHDGWLYACYDFVGHVQSWCLFNDVIVGELLLRVLCVVI